MNKLFGLAAMFLGGTFVGFFGVLEASGRYTLQVMLHETAIFVLITVGACALGMLFLRRVKLV